MIRFNHDFNPKIIRFKRVYCAKRPRPHSSNATEFLVSTMFRLEWNMGNSDIRTLHKHEDSKQRTDPEPKKTGREKDIPADKQHAKKKHRNLSPSAASGNSIQSTQPN